MTNRSLRSLMISRNTGLALLFVAEIALISALIPGYFSLSGLLNATQGFVEPAIIALGMTLVIITGGIDISVGSLLALVVVSVGFSYDRGLPMPLAMMLGLLVGAAGGALNGGISTVLRLNPLVVTLGTLALYRGISLAISNAEAVSSFPDWFGFIGQGNLGPAPFQLFIFILLATGCAVTLRWTSFGRDVYAVGANEMATRFSGKSPDRIRFIVFTLQGLLVGIAGIIYCARVSSARGNEGFGLEFVVITMVVFGGSRITGGHGTILGTVLGGLIIWYIQDGMGYAGVSSDWGLLLTGVFLLGSVLFGAYAKEIRNVLTLAVGARS
jgi:rhamnose transport system permease protein